MGNENKILAVARYLEGDMEPQEREAFEAQLSQDPELQELCIQYENIHQTLKMKIAPHEADLQVQETLATMNKQYFKSVPTESVAHEVMIPTVEPQIAKTVSMKTYLKWISVAAVLIIGLFVWAPWSSSLYDQYSYSKQMTVAERGAEQQDKISQAAVLYNEGDYKGARNLLQQEYMLSPQDPLLAYYFAITLIETGQEYEARTVLINLYNGKSVLKYDAAFYVALSFVKEEDNKQALEWLAKIPEDNVNFSKAQSLMRALK